MDREQGSMYFNLSDIEFQAVCETANKYDKTMGEALAMLITKGLESIRNEPRDDNKDDTALSRIENKVDELIQVSDVLPCWDENKNDSLSPSNYTARFDQIDKTLTFILKRIETIPCCWNE